MKTLRNLFVLASILLFIIFSFNCNDQNSLEIQSSEELNKQTEVEVQSDGINELIKLRIYEYVKVTPQQQASYYELRGVAEYECTNCIQPSVKNSGSFTTPFSSRYEGTTLVETQYFTFVESVNLYCRSIYKMGRFSVSNGYLDYYYQPVYNPTCGNYTTYATKYSENQYLSSNTSYQVTYGCIDIQDEEQ